LQDFLAACLENIRQDIYSNEEIWQQVWSSLKHYNRINNASFAAMLNLPLTPPAPILTETKPAAKKQPPGSKGRGAGAPAKKAPAKKAANAFALLGDGEDFKIDAEPEQPITAKKVEASSSSSRTKSAPAAKAGTSVEKIEVDFALRALDLSDLGFISEDLIVRLVLQPRQSHPSTNCGRSDNFLLPIGR
jgi:hypothetical protein